MLIKTECPILFSTPPFSFRSATAAFAIQAIVFNSGYFDCHDSVDFTSPERFESEHDFLILHYSTNRNKQNVLLSGHVFESKSLVILVDWFLVANRRTTCFEFMHIHLVICSNLWKTYGELFSIKWSPCWLVDSCCGFGTLKNSPWWITLSTV